MPMYLFNTASFLALTGQAPTGNVSKSNTFHNPYRPISRPQSRPLGSKNPTSVPAQTQSILSGKITHKHENSVTGSYRNRGDNVAVEEREEEERATPTCASPSSFKNGYCCV
eukprot:551192-Amorphochlora_amoeboformis.AAC.1